MPWRPAASLYPFPAFTLGRGRVGPDPAHEQGGAAPQRRVRVRRRERGGVGRQGQGQPQRLV